MYFEIDENTEVVPERCDPEELEKMIAEYLVWLSEELSTDGNIRSRSAYDKLVEIGF